MAEIQPPAYGIVAQRLNEITPDAHITGVIPFPGNGTFVFQLQAGDRTCEVEFSEECLEDLRDYDGSKASNCWQETERALTAKLVAPMERSGVIPYTEETLKEIIFEHAKTETQRGSQINKFNLVGRPYQRGSLEGFLKVRFRGDERHAAALAFDELRKQGLLIPTYTDSINPEDWVKAGQEPPRPHSKNRQAELEEKSVTHALAVQERVASISAVQDLMELLQLYECTMQETSVFEGVPHDQLITAMNQFLFHHGSVLGITGWGDCLQNRRDGGVDSIWSCRSSSDAVRLGIQIKSHGDFENPQADSFRRVVLAQITESRQIALAHLVIGFCANLTSASQREKCRGLLADVTAMTDNYVIAIAPEKMAGIWRWHQGLRTAPLEQMREAGYGWLTAVYDSLGNINHNSWGKGTGGDWSQARTTTTRVGQDIVISAVGMCSVPGILDYKFAIQRSGRGFEIRQDWSPRPTWTWSIVREDIGRNVSIMVSVRRVKDYYQFNGEDDYTYAIYDVLPPKDSGA